MGILIKIIFPGNSREFPGNGKKFPGNRFLSFPGKLEPLICVSGKVLLKHVTENENGFSRNCTTSVRDRVKGIKAG